MNPPRTEDEKRNFVKAWRASGKTQEAWCREDAVGAVAPRTLRLWARRYAPPGEPVEAARRVLRDAIGKLQALLDGLDADPACREAETVHMPCGEPEPVDVPEPSPTARRAEAPELEQRDVLPAAEARETPPPAPATPIEAAMQRRPKANSFFRDWADVPSDPPATQREAEVPNAPVVAASAPAQPTTPEQKVATEPRRLPMPTGGGMLSWV